MPISPTQDVPAIGEDNQGKVTLAESRIRDGWHAHSIFRKLEWDDTNAEEARAKIDYQIDGGLPYSPQVMRDANRGDEANVNFREAKAEDDLAQTPFIEMTTVTPILWNIQASHGNETDRVQWGRIISEKFTKTVRDWGEDFDYFRLRLAQQFTRHGAGFTYWEDEYDWRWRSDGLSPFKLPRKTESRTSAIPYCICKREMSIDELYRKIRNEKATKDLGLWNIDAVKRALVYASSSGQTWYNYGWEQFQKEVKENDIEFSTRSEMVRIFHLWCREFDGTVSHYIGLQDGVQREPAGRHGREWIPLRTSLPISFLRERHHTVLLRHRHARHGSHHSRARGDELRPHLDFQQDALQDDRPRHGLVHDRHAGRLGQRRGECCMGAARGLHGRLRAEQ